MPIVGIVERAGQLLDRLRQPQPCPGSERPRRRRVASRGREVARRPETDIAARVDDPNARSRPHAASISIPPVAVVHDEHLLDPVLSLERVEQPEEGRTGAVRHGHDGGRHAPLCAASRPARNSAGSERVRSRRDHPTGRTSSAVPPCRSMNCRILASETASPRSGASFMPRQQELLAQAKGAQKRINAPPRLETEHERDVRQASGKPLGRRDTEPAGTRRRTSPRSPPTACAEGRGTSTRSRTIRIRTARDPGHR